ncbi:hypothetical protein V8201_02395 [Sphingomonas kyungheensis]|uniref:Uncharacterized protein n=2 Tax=Sphingomonas kyungheensis TaxID=1069987 RepID=A0ABU8GYK0_9SPHN
MTARSTAWIAPTGGIAGGIAVAALFLLVPQTVLEDWVWQSGMPALIAAAAPPLGATARALLALGGGLVTAAVAWSALFLLFGAGGLFARTAAADTGVPVLRRADAHPDAPARRPMSAADLGTPLPPPTPPAAADEPPVVQSIPVDLNQPLAAYHPGALPDVPREPVRPVMPLRPPVSVVEPEPVAIEPEPEPEPEPEVKPEDEESVEAAPAITEPVAEPIVEAPAASPAPAPAPAPASAPAPAEVPSIESLLDRLERGTRQRRRA